MPTQKQSQDENTVDGCPGNDWCKGHPIHVTIDLMVTSSTQMCLPFEDVTSWIPFSMKSPDHWDGIRSSWNLRSVDHFPMFQLCMLISSHCITSMNLSLSDCCNATCKGIALGYPFGCTMMETKVWRGARG